MKTACEKPSNQNSRIKPKAGVSSFENTPVFFERNQYEVVYEGSNLYSVPNL